MEFKSVLNPINQTHTKNSKSSQTQIPMRDPIHSIPTTQSNPKVTFGSQNLKESDEIGILNFFDQISFHCLVHSFSGKESLKSIRFHK